MLPAARTRFSACLPEGGVPGSHSQHSREGCGGQLRVWALAMRDPRGEGPEAPASRLRPPHHRGQSPEKQVSCPGKATGPTWVSVSLTFRWEVGLRVSKRRPPPRQAFWPGSRAHPRGAQAGLPGSLSGLFPRTLYNLSPSQKYGCK